MLSDSDDGANGRDADPMWKTGAIDYQALADAGDGTASPLQRISMSALLRQHRTLRQPVIDGMFRVGETANVIAPPKIGKSWFVMGMAFDVAAGRPWLGRFPTSGGKVLVLDNELHPETLAHRLRIVAEASGASLADIGERIEVVSLRGHLQSVATLAEFFQTIRSGEFSLVILDALYRAMPTGMDENSNASMAGLYNLIDTYSEHLQSAFALVHHASKGNQSGKAVTDVGAGAGAQSRATDAHLVLRPHEEADAVVLDAAVRSFAPIEPLCLRWRFPLFSVATDLDPSKLKTPTNKSDAKADEVSVLLKLDGLDPKRDGTTERALRTALGWGQDRVKRTVQRLRDENIIEAVQVAATAGKGAQTTRAGIRRPRA